MRTQKYFTFFLQPTTVHSNGLSPSSTTSSPLLRSPILPVTGNPGHSHLCSSAQGDIIVPQTNTKTLGQRNYAVNRPVIWNRLPTSIRKPETVSELSSSRTEDILLPRSLSKSLGVLAMEFSYKNMRTSHL